MTLRPVTARRSEASVAARRVLRHYAGAALDLRWSRIALVVILAARGVDGTVLLHRDEVRRRPEPAADLRVR